MSGSDHLQPAIDSPDPSRHIRDAFHLGGKMRRIVFVMAAAVTLASCAKRPDAIVPVDIPIAAYNGQSCTELAQELVRERAILASLSQQQNSAATGDAVGVFLLGVPMSSTFGGDKEGQVAVSKGKVNAIESTIKSKACKAGKTS